MSRTRILAAGFAVLLSAVPALAQRHPSTNHPSLNHPSTNHPSTNHPSTNHPSADHPSLAHLSTNHPSLAHLSPNHPSINHPSLNHGYTGGVYQTGYAGGFLVADTVPTGGGYGYGGGSIYRGTTYRHGHSQGGGGFYGIVPDITGATPTTPTTFDINSYLANFPQQPGAILDPALIPAIGRPAVQPMFTTSPPRRGGSDNP